MFYLNPLVFETYFNCTQRTQKEWEKEGSPNLLLGTFYIGIGIIFITLYTAALFALGSKELIKNSAYKMMFVLGIIDIVALCVICLISGYFTIIGSVFCLNRKITYFSGIIVLGCWTSSCCINYILALSRVLDLYSPYLSNLLLGGYKTYIVLLIPIAYGMYFMFFTSPLLFTSKSYALAVDPYSEIENVNLNNFDYSNYSLTINDTSLLFILPVLYIIFFYLLYRRHNGNNTSQFSNLQTNLIKQTIFITSTYFLASVSYTYFNLNPGNLLCSVAGHLMWQLSHATPSLVYLFLNRSIQAYILANYVPKCVKNLLRCVIKNAYKNKTRKIIPAAVIS